MPRGGKRQGTPGKAYSNRTDMATNYDPRLTETQQLKKWLPILEPIGRQEDTPDSVRTLIRYIRGS